VQKDFNETKDENPRKLRVWQCMMEKGKYHWKEAFIWRNLGIFWWLLQF